VDDVALLPLDPTQERRQHQMERDHGPESTRISTSTEFLDSTG
jgi:hypothetical protein